MYFYILQYTLYILHHTLHLLFRCIPFIFIFFSFFFFEEARKLYAHTLHNSSLHPHQRDSNLEPPRWRPTSLTVALRSGDINPPLSQRHELLESRNLGDQPPPPHPTHIGQSHLFICVFPWDPQVASLEHEIPIWSNEVTHLCIKWINLVIVGVFSILSVFQKEIKEENLISYLLNFINNDKKISPIYHKLNSKQSPIRRVKFIKFY
jgi:hypothetical protein